MLRSRLQQFFQRRPSYGRLEDGERDPDEVDNGDLRNETTLPPFSWLEYGIFVWMGVSMLWAWYVKLLRPVYLTAGKRMGSVRS